MLRTSHDCFLNVNPQGYMRGGALSGLRRFCELDEKNAKWSHVCGCIAATESAPKSQKATIWTLWVDPKPMFWSTGPTQANRSAADMPHFGRALAPIPKTRKVITWESRMVCGCIAATCSDP